MNWIEVNWISVFYLNYTVRLIFTDNSSLYLMSLFTSFTYYWPMNFAVFWLGTEGIQSRTCVNKLFRSDQILYNAVIMLLCFQTKDNYTYISCKKPFNTIMYAQSCVTSINTVAYKRAHSCIHSTCWGTNVHYSQIVAFLQKQTYNECWGEHVSYTQNNDGKLNEFFKNKATQKGKQPMKYLI